MIVGGGITGLAAAHRLVELKRQASVDLGITLLEASERIGGVFGTEQIGDYTIECGADSFITNKPGGIDLAVRLGMQDRLITTNEHFRRSLILHRGKPVETPVGFNLLAPAKIWPMVTTPLLSMKGKLRAAQELFIRKKSTNDDESLADFVRRRFGTEMLDRIVQPMVGGIYTSDPERLSLMATLPRFLELEKTYGSLIRGMRQSAKESVKQEAASGARYGLFVTPRSGMQDLLTTLLAAIQTDVEIRFGAKAKSVDTTPTGLSVQFSSGEPLAADGVVLALPSFQSAELLRRFDATLAAGLDEIEYASSAIVVSGHKLSDISHPLNAFGLVIPHCEGRRILAVSFLNRKFPGRAPGDRAILRTFVGGAMQPEEFDRTDDEIAETVLSELHDILGVHGEPDFVRIARYPRGMPQYTVGHLERVSRIQSLASQYDRIALAGNAFTGVGIPDCVQSGELAANSIWKNIIKST